MTILSPGLKYHVYLSPHCRSSNGFSTYSNSSSSLSPFVCTRVLLPLPAPVVVVAGGDCGLTSETGRFGRRPSLVKSTLERGAGPATTCDDWDWTNPETGTGPNPESELGPWDSGETGAGPWGVVGNAPGTSRVGSSIDTEALVVPTSCFAPEATITFSWGKDGGTGGPNGSMLSV